MAQDLEKIVASLTSGKYVPAIVLLGTDSYLREMCRTKILDACVPEAARGWAVAWVSALRVEAGWDEILQRAQTLPMMSPRQVIIVDGAESVEKLGDKARDEILESLGKYLDSPAPFTTLLRKLQTFNGRQKFFRLYSMTKR